MYNMLIDGNDERGIDVGLYSKHPIRSIHSNIGLGLPGERTFSRDCAEFEIETPGGDTIWVLGEPLQEQGLRLRVQLQRAPGEAGQGRRGDLPEPRRRTIPRWPWSAT